MKIGLYKDMTYTLLLNLVFYCFCFSLSLSLHHPVHSLTHTLTHMHTHSRHAKFQTIMECSCPLLLIVFKFLRREGSETVSNSSRAANNKREIVRMNL